MPIFPGIIRNWFMAMYVLGILSFLIISVYIRSRRKHIEKHEGPIPSPGIIILFGIPLILLILRFGEITAGWFYIRWMGLGLSTYFLIVLPWFMLTLGRFAIPGSAVYQDHKLVTSGPYSFVRHPLYSASAALWLGAALGTLNWLLLGLFPLVIYIIMRYPVRQEEALLRDKFGKKYEEYASKTPGILPALW
jgi:protein-S-isoprenylcysteine O-methyltransferase Ste14